MTINVALLLHNEEEIFALLTRLGDCPSLGVVQILDDYSEPGFVDYVKVLCEHHGFRFAQRHLNLDFSAQRNHVMDMLPTDEWVFVIDADEMIPVWCMEKCVESITSVPDADSFSVSRKNVTIGWDNVHRVVMEKSIRLMRNSRQFRWVNRVHEGQTGLFCTHDISDQIEIEHVKTAARCKKQHLWYRRNFYSNENTDVTEGTPAEKLRLFESVPPQP